MTTAKAEAPPGTAAPPPPGRVVPGDLLLQPVSVVAVAVLVVNDHWLKRLLGADPRLGVATGKLSDVAGLVVFPLVLASLLELSRWRRGGRGSRAVTRRELAVGAAVTGFGFAAVKVVPVAAEGYVGGLAVLRWLPAGLVAASTGASLPPLPRLHHVMDLSDCVCLPGVWLGYRVGARARA